MRIRRATAESTPPAQEKPGPRVAKQARQEGSDDGLEAPSPVDARSRTEVEQRVRSLLPKGCL